MFISFPAIVSERVELVSLASSLLEIAKVSYISSFFRERCRRLNSSTVIYYNPSCHLVA